MDTMTALEPEQISIRGLIVAGLLILMLGIEGGGFFILWEYEMITPRSGIIGMALSVVMFPVTCWLAHDYYLLPIWRRQLFNANWHQTYAELQTEIAEARAMCDAGTWN